MKELPMRTHITARHTDISQGFRSSITNDLEGLTRIFSRINAADVIIAVDAGTPIAEITVRLNHHVFFAKSEGASLTQAFAVALEKAERQIRKYKGKLVGRRTVEHKVIDEVEEEEAIMEEAESVA